MENPEGGYVHAMHTALWGDMHWEIKGKNEDGTLQLEGGWQNNRPSGMHPLYRFVENIKEELDVPGEWYYDRSESKLYYMPLPEIDLDEAKVEIVRLKHLIEFNGTKENPVRGIHLQGLTFKHTARTFMEIKSNYCAQTGPCIGAEPLFSTVQRSVRLKIVNLTIWEGIRFCE